MYQKITYIADDGTEFKYEKDCKAYEERRNLKTNIHCSFFNEDWDKIKDYDDLDALFHIKIYDEVGYEMAEEILEEYGICYRDISNEGTYPFWISYNEETEGFINTSSLIKELEDKLCYLKKSEKLS